MSRPIGRLFCYFAQNALGKEGNILYSVRMEDNFSAQPQSPRLVHRAEFEETISNYQPSDHARRVLGRVTFAVMSGPTAAGRNTIIWELVKTGKYHYVISDTTRPKRQNNGEWEEDGKEYWFRSEADVLRDLKAGEFLEAEVIHGQQVSGISIRELERATREHRIAITDVDIGGVANALDAKEDTIALLVLPPDFHTWQQRLSKRGEMDPLELKRRLQTAERIFQMASQDDRLHIVLNDTIEHATQQVRNIVEGGSVGEASRRRLRRVAERLEQDTNDFLLTLS